MARGMLWCCIGRRWLRLTMGVSRSFRLGCLKTCVDLQLQHSRWSLSCSKHANARQQLSGLLNSTADGHSSLSGQDLVADKVAELIIMGGAYPSGREWNFFGGNVSLARHVVDAWGRLTPVTYVGDELGRLVISGDRLMAEGPEGDPVKAAYEWYSYGRGERPSWDALAVLWALGDDEMLEFGNEGGYNQVAADGSNAWVWDGSEKGQHWLKMRDGVDGAAVGERLEELYLKGAWDAIRDSSSSDDDGRKEL